MNVNANTDDRHTGHTLTQFMSVECQPHNQRGHIWAPQSGSDWPKIEQIRDFFTSDFSTFWFGEPEFTETDLKKSQICPISVEGQSEPIWSQT